MKRHPLDGNMIAADAHYDQEWRSYGEECQRCYRSYDMPDIRGVWIEPHRLYDDLCEECGDEVDGEV